MPDLAEVVVNGKVIMRESKPKYIYKTKSGRKSA